MLTRLENGKRKQAKTGQKLKENPNLNKEQMDDEFIDEMENENDIDI